MHPKYLETYVVIMAIIIIAMRPYLFFKMAKKLKRSEEAILKQQLKIARPQLVGLQQKRRRLETKDNNVVGEIIVISSEDEDE